MSRMIRVLFTILCTLFLSGIVLADSPFTVNPAHPKGDAWVELAEQAAEALAEQIPPPYPERIEIRIFDSASAYEAEVGGALHWSIAAALPSRNRLLVNGVKIDPVNAPMSVLKHEITHLYLGEIERRTGQRIPRWFNEGLAQMLGGEGLAGSTAPPLPGREVRLENLSISWPTEADRARTAYAIALDAVRRMRTEFSLDAPLEVLKAIDRETTFLAAFESTTGQPLATFYRDVQPWMHSPSLTHQITNLLQNLGFWGILGVVVIIAYFIVRARGKRTIERMESEDAWMESLDDDHWETWEDPVDWED